MKKVILCASALAFGAVAFAQQSNPAPQENNAQSAGLVTVEASDNANGTADSNAGEAHQEGNDNFIKLRQAGTNQSAYFMQSNGTTGTGMNKAYVRQTGEVQSTSGVMNEATMTQNGTSNEGTILQEGDENEAISNQMGSTNKLKIQQGNGQQAQFNFAAVKQEGDNNVSSVLQTYDNNSAYNDQSGNSNYSSITQDANPNLTNGHSAQVMQSEGGQVSYVEQSGSNGNALVEQDGAGSGGTNASQVIQTGQVVDGNDMFADVYQSGDGNASKVMQTALGSDAAGMEAEVKQDGDGNESKVTQTGSGLNTAMVWQGEEQNDAQIDQINNTTEAANSALINQGYMTIEDVDGTTQLTGGGTTDLFNQSLPSDTDPSIPDMATTVKDFLDGAGNNANVNNGSFKGLAFIDQVGSGNTAEAHQFGDDFNSGNLQNYSEQTQRGEDNAALVLQNAYGADSGKVNFAVQSQQGENGEDVSGNEATIAQNGWSHEAYQAQMGNDNQAIALQTGNSGGGSASMSWQSGDNNYALTIQTGAPGGGNAAYVVQEGGQSFVGIQSISGPQGNSSNGNTIESLQVGPNGDLSQMVDCEFPGKASFSLTVPGAGTPPVFDDTSFCADCQ